MSDRDRVNRVIGRIEANFNRYSHTCLPPVPALPQPCSFSKIKRATRPAVLSGFRGTVARDAH